MSGKVRETDIAGCGIDAHGLTKKNTAYFRGFEGRRVYTWFLAISLALAALTSTAHADDAGDINKLILQGQLPEAMQRTDAFLTQHPKDAQVRFLKGIIYAEQGKTNDAIIVFTKLTEDYPQLPEPYNNLAVLFASANQFDKARAALEMAIRTNPSYGTAHENLGDVYAKLASQSYDKALQLDTGNNGAKIKLTLIRNLFGHSNTSIASSVVSSKPAAVPFNNLKSASTPPVVVAAIAPVPVSAANKPVAAKHEVAKADSAKSNLSRSGSHNANNGEHDDVLKILDAWATAWSEKNTNAYLAFYSKDFQVPKGITRKAWSDSRRARIEGKGRIQVKINAPKVAIDGSTATVKFRQIYNSDQLRADGPKTLVLNKQGGKWQIMQERAGS